MGDKGMNTLSEDTRDMAMKIMLKKHIKKVKYLKKNIMRLWEEI
jgi:hypothetical protein